MERRGGAGADAGGAGRGNAGAGEAAGAGRQAAERTAPADGAGGGDEWVRSVRGMGASTVIRTVEAMHYRSLRYVRQGLQRLHVLLGPNTSEWRDRAVPGLGMARCRREHGRNRQRRPCPTTSLADAHRLAYLRSSRKEPRLRVAEHTFPAMRRRYGCAAVPKSRDAAHTRFSASRPQRPSGRALDEGRHRILP